MRTSKSSGDIFYFLDLNHKTNHDSFQVELIIEKKIWDNYLKTSNFYDPFHTYDFHQHCLQKNEYPILFSCGTDKSKIAIPLIIRKIPDTAYFDAISTYGYSGIIYTGNPDKETTDAFQNNLKEFLIRNHIITVFARLNPLVHQQESALQHLGTVTQPGWIINIDLTLTEEEQTKKYRKRLKTYIRSIREKVDLEIATTKEQIDEFTEIYHETMDRVNSHENLYYSKTNIHDLVHGNGFDNCIVLAKEKETGKTIAGSLFLFNKTACHYYLSGTKTDYLSLQPSKLIIDFMRTKCNSMGLHYFFLGGGLGGKKNHKLYQFKSGFSKDTHPFKVWKYVVNDEKYQELKRYFGIKVETEESFFPVYRSPEALIK